MICVKPGNASSINSPLATKRRLALRCVVSLHKRLIFCLPATAPAQHGIKGAHMSGKSIALTEGSSVAEFPGAKAARKGNTASLERLRENWQRALVADRGLPDGPPCVGIAISWHLK